MTTTDVTPTQLPPTVRAFLEAHAARDVDAAARTFSPAAVVQDQGQTFRGTAELLDFLRHQGGEFTYTTELLGGRRIDEAHWVAVNRLEGDFPGGVADLDYRFTLAQGLITELVIGG
jgi:limonene-1,2-epoxide hydrolase